MVAEVDTSTSTGQPEVGKPTDTGLGVNTGSSPPNGATLAELASEQCSSMTKPWRVARSWYAAKQAMWWLRRITTVQVPWVRARCIATSMACRVNQGPGKRCPSQVSAAGKSDTTRGAPSLRMEPDSISPKYGASSASPCVVWPSKSPSTNTSATAWALSAGRPAACKRSWAKVVRSWMA